VHRLGVLPAKILLSRRGECGAAHPGEGKELSVKTWQRIRKVIAWLFLPAFADDASWGKEARRRRRKNWRGKNRERSQQWPQPTRTTTPTNTWLIPLLKKKLRWHRQERRGGGGGGDWPQGCCPREIETILCSLLLSSSSYSFFLWEGRIFGNFLILVLCPSSSSSEKRMFRWDGMDLRDIQLGTSHSGQLRILACSTSLVRRRFGGTCLERIHGFHPP